jgi:hypothetical protein
MNRDFYKLVVFVHEWARLEAKLGRRIGIEAYVAENGVDSRRTAYSRLELFRRMFRDELGPKCTPDDLIVWPHGVPEVIELDALGWSAVPA